MPLTYSYALLTLFYLLMVAEFFIPSGGLLGAVAAVTAIAAVVIAFTHSLFAGMGFLAAIVFSTPIVIYAMVCYWPHTRLGSRILNRRPGQVDDPVVSRLPTGEKRSDLIGRIGVAKTHLLPGGQVEIDGRKLDAVTDGHAIDAGTQVVVISTTAGKIHVRTATRADLSPEQVDAERKTESIESALESLDLDSMDS